MDLLIVFYGALFNSDILEYIELVTLILGKDNSMKKLACATALILAMSGSVYAP